VDGTVVLYNKVFSARKYMKLFSPGEEKGLETSVYLKVPSTIVDAYGPGPHPFYFRVHVGGEEATALERTVVAGKTPITPIPPTAAPTPTPGTLKNASAVVQGRFGNAHQYSSDMLWTVESNSGAFQRQNGVHAVGWSSSSSR